MKRILKTIKHFFTGTTTEEYWAWEWESEAERQAFGKYFKFAN